MFTVERRSTLKIWGDVIFALFLREIRSQFNDKFGVSWAIINPLIFIFILSYFRSFLGGNTTHYMPTLIFMIYGMLMVRLFLATFDSCASAISKNKALFAFRQVQPISTIIALALFEFLTIIFVIIVLYLIIYLLNVEFQLNDPLVIFSCIFQVWLFGCSFGLLFAIGQAYFPELNKLKIFIQRPIFFMSGIFFSLKDIPKDYWYIFDWNPILHAIELSRGASFLSFNSQGVSLSYLFFCTLIVFSFSLFTYQVSWKRVLSR